MVIDLSEPEPLKVRIDLHDGSLDLELSPIPIDARIVDDALAQSGQAYLQCLHRLDAVSGWHGVQSLDGNPIEFSKSAFRSLLAKRPEIIRQLGPAIQKLFSVDDAPVSPAEPAQA